MLLLDVRGRGLRCQREMMGGLYKVDRTQHPSRTIEYITSYQFESRSISIRIM